MICAGFLSPEDRADLIALARDGLAAHRLARRANALVLLDDGWSCEAAAKALFVDDDTVRSWFSLYVEHGLDGLAWFGHEGSSCRLSGTQQAQLKTWVQASLPASARSIGAYIERQFGIVYDSRAGLIALLHRLGLEYRKPETIGRGLDEDEQRTFIAAYDKLLNRLAANETVLFADAVHPTHAARPSGCWAAKGEKLAVGQTSGRERLNIHGAINLETGQTRMMESDTIDALSTLRLLHAIEALYPAKRCIHVFLDNARYHRAKLVQTWLAEPGRRIRLHFIPPYCPHLNPIERLWAVMHKHVTHNKCYATARAFALATLTFLRQTVPRNWADFRDSITDNFRVISPNNFRVIA